jgi:60 kDa SS-A/Ro ribonucleoprotein
MARLNVNRRPQLPPQGGIPPRIFEPSNTLRTHEGAPAAMIPPEMALRRSVCSCLLWEGEFYEGGQSIADRIIDLAGQVAPRALADLALDARSHFNLRHVPLLLCAVLARTGSGSRLVGDTIAETIQRADELSEFLVVYAKVNGVEPKAVRKRLSAQVKRGLAMAFGKFDRYALAKYFSPSAESGQPIKARDVMFMVHPRPKDEPQAALWKALIAGEVKGADTWERNLSEAPNKDISKKEAWEQQIDRWIIE